MLGAWAYSTVPTRAKSVLPQWPQRRVRCLLPAVGLQAATATATAAAATAVLFPRVRQPFGRFDAAAMRGDERACCGGCSTGAA